jgi:predicted transcriptional regulator
LRSEVIDLRQQAEEKDNISLVSKLNESHAELKKIRRGKYKRFKTGDETKASAKRIADL